MPEPGSPNRLLVLDDNEQVNAMIHRIGTRCGYLVRTSQNEQQFLQGLAEHSPTVVLMDVFLGSHDCTRLLDYLAIRQRQKPFTMVIMSGADEAVLERVSAAAEQKGVSVQRLIYRKRELFQLEDLLHTMRRDIPAAELRRLAS